MYKNKQNTTVKKDDLVYTYTKKINNKVNEIFAGQSQTVKDKVLFLINLINKNTRMECINMENIVRGYQLHNQNHTDFFGIRSGDMQLKEIKDLLTQHQIIYMSGQYLVGSTSMEYAITKAYQYKYDEGEIKISYPTKKDIKKTFLKKFVADDYVVKSSKDSSYVPTTKKTQEVIEQEFEETQSLKTDVETLQYQMKLMQEMASEFEKMKTQLINDKMEIEKILKIKEEQINFLLQEVEELKSLKESGVLTVKEVSVEIPKTIDLPVETKQSKMVTTYDNYIEVLISKGYNDTQSVIDLTTKRYVNNAMPEVIKQTTVQNIVGAVNRIIIGN